jgi:hypothetical protein
MAQKPTQILKHVISNIIIIFFIAACSGHPKQTLLKQMNNLDGFSKVAVSSTSNMLDLNYSMQSTQLLIPSFFWGLALQEYYVRKIIDYQNSYVVKENIKVNQIEILVCDTFIELIRNSKIFSVINQIDKTNNRDSISSNYDAIIELSVKTISIEKTLGENVKLQVTVAGKAQDLKSKNVFWKRDETIKSKEVKPIDYEKQNALPDLEPMLIKAARNLAYDFIYLKK